MASQIAVALILENHWHNPVTCCYNNLLELNTQRGSRFPLTGNEPDLSMAFGSTSWGFPEKGGECNVQIWHLEWEHLGTPGNTWEPGGSDQLEQVKIFEAKW